MRKKFRDEMNIKLDFTFPERFWKFGITNTFPVCLDK